MIRKLSRREFISVSGLGMGAAWLSACTPGLTGTQTTPVVQLVYQDWRTDWFPAMAREMLERFHADHPDIHVFYSPDPDDYVTRMPTDMVSGIAADVFQGCCTHFPAWAQMGHVLDLRPYVERDLDPETIADWDPAQYEALITREGLQFGLPKYHGALVLYYNKDLFDEQGVAYPDAGWDHDSYLAAMRRLTHDRDGDGILDQWGSAIDVSWDRIQVHVNAWGGHFVDPEDPTHSCMADSEASRPWNGCEPACGATR